MQLFSTKDTTVRHSWSEAVLRGLAPDGGLYLPVEIPHLPGHCVQDLSSLPFPSLAYEVSRLFLGGEVPDATLRSICASAFSFEVPLRDIGDNTHILELFHGPTCAFKDFGARFMAQLFRYFLGETSTPLTVLVATSGDTGSAVAHAFFDVRPNPSIRVAVLFPKGKVSLVQEKQMTTLGHNVTAFEVDGTFDDCQAIVKMALADKELAQIKRLTSANSINIARLLPQIFYYIYAALKFPIDTPPVFSVPSGNLGNLTGGLIGHMMGMPASHFIAACNSNAPFPDYLQTGRYAPRTSHDTLSNAMDVGSPSNYARILSLYGDNLSLMQASITGESVTDARTIDTIKRTYETSGYIVDPHTAVGVCALERYRAKHGATRPGVVLATAHPAKFSATVQRAIGIEPNVPAQLSKDLDKEGIKKAIGTSYDAFRQLIG